MCEQEEIHMKRSTFFGIVTISSCFTNSSIVLTSIGAVVVTWKCGQLALVNSRELRTSKSNNAPGYGAYQRIKNVEQIGCRTINNVWKSSLSDLVSVALEVVALKQVGGVVNSPSQRAEVNRGESIDFASISTNIHERWIPLCVV